MIAIGLRAFAVMGASFLLSLLALLTVKGMGVDLKDVSQRTKPRVLLVASAFNLLFVLTVWMLLKLLDGKSLTILGFGLRANDLFAACVAIGITFGFAILFVRLWEKMGQWKVQRVRIPFTFSMDGMALPLAYLSLLLAAFQEEVMFRGYLNAVMEQLGFLEVVLLSSAIFTVWHFLTNKVQLYQALDWFVSGVMLMVAYRVSGSIWVVTFIHFNRNLANVLIWNIAGQGSIYSFDRQVNPKWKTAYTLVLSLVMMVLIWVCYQV